MNAISITTRIDSTTLTLPELSAFLGKKVQLIVLEEPPQTSTTAEEPRPSQQPEGEFPPVRQFGTMRGQFIIPDDFDAPLPPEIQRYFDGEAED